MSEHEASVNGASINGASINVEGNIFFKCFISMIIL